MFSQAERGQGIVPVMFPVGPVSQGRHGTISTTVMNCRLLAAPEVSLSLRNSLRARLIVPAPEPLTSASDITVPHVNQREPCQSPPGAALATAGHKELIIPAGSSTFTSHLLPAAVKGSSVTTSPLKCNPKVPHQLPRCLDLFQAACSSLSWI